MAATNSNNNTDKVKVNGEIKAPQTNKVEPKKSILETLDFTALMQEALDSLAAKQKGKGGKSRANNGEPSEIPVAYKLTELEGLGLKPLTVKLGYFARYGSKQRAHNPTRQTIGNAAALILMALIQKGEANADLVHEIALQSSTQTKSYDPAKLLDLVSLFSGQSVRLYDDGRLEFGADPIGKRGQSRFTAI